MVDIPPLPPMDSVFARLRTLCRAQRDTAEKLCNASKKLETLADITTDIQAIKDEIQLHGHELANLTTIVGGWRALAEVDDGRATLMNKIVTAGGRTDSRVILLQIVAYRGD